MHQDYMIHGTRCIHELNQGTVIDRRKICQSSMKMHIEEHGAVLLFKGFCNTLNKLMCVIAE